MSLPPQAGLPPAIIWDMDGTLVDSEPIWTIATYELSEQLGRRLTPALRATTIGGSFANTYRVAATHAGIPVTPEGQAHWYRWMVARMTELFAERLSVDPRVRTMLQHLAEAGVAMAVATNTPRILADPPLQVIGTAPFVTTICGDEVDRGKPDPEMYLTAAAALGVNPVDCLVFEDSPTGMAAGVAAGMTVVGLPGSQAPQVPAGAIALAEFTGGETSHAEVLYELGATGIAHLWQWLQQRSPSLRR
ncbi:HAD family hydrolase [Corynebacterium choanae]|uniref:HAD family hydrolase n=1 Tax=Corynebacterium choanae TaxID=1862358 RepID=UPI0019CFF2AA|nr:HAD family phosphatase [Corynebacterium choanae]